MRGAILLVSDAALCCSAKMQSEYKEWSDVRVFLAVMRQGSTLAAARVLGMNQTTVSRRIDVLEHSLGLKLFEKTTRGAVPTSDATALMDDAESIERCAAGFAKTANSLRDAQTNTIRLTAISDAFNDQFAAILEEFKTRHGNVQFELLSREERLDVLAGEADVAVRLSNAKLAFEPSLICRRMFELPMSLFVSRAYAEKYGVPVGPSDLPNHKVVLFGGELATHPANEWLLAQAGTAQVAMTCKDFRSISTTVKMGVGIGIMPSRFKITNPDLVQCFELSSELGSTGWLIINPSAYRRPEVKAFTKFFAPRYAAYYRATQQKDDA